MPRVFNYERAAALVDATLMGDLATAEKYDAEFLDALVFAWNERQIPPDQ